MKPYRILHMIGGGEIGGAEHHVLSLLQGLNHSHFIPSLICLNRGPFANLAANSGIPTETFPMHFPLDLSPLPSLISRLRKSKIDLIHTHGSRANLLGRLGAKCLGLPCISTVHSSLAYDYLSPWSAWLAIELDKLTLPLTSGIITVSEHLAAEVALRGGKNIETIYNGQIPQSYTSSPGRSQFRRQWDIPDHALVLGTIGRLHPTKGQIFMIKAAMHLQAEFPNLYLLFIGDGPLRGDLERELQDSKLSYKFAGYLPHAYEALTAMDLFILPSISEGMGLVLLEAMNAQVPIVASSVGGIPEVIRSGIDGVLVPPGDVSKLREACRSVLKNPEFASSLVQSAQKRRSLFSLEKMIKETEQIYFRLLE